MRAIATRILLFYVLSITLIGLNGEASLPNINTHLTVVIIVPWDYPNLSNKSTTTSPFTIVFAQAGSRKYIFPVSHISAEGLANSYSSVIYEYRHPNLCTICW